MINVFFYFGLIFKVYITNLTSITKGNLCFKSAKQFKKTLIMIGFNVNIIYPKIKDFAPHIIIKCIKNSGYY